MELLLSTDFVRTFFITVSFVVTGIVFFGYYKNKFSIPLAWSVIVILLAYASLFFWERYSSGHVSEHMSESTAYIVIGAVHGIIALWVIGQTCTLFAYATRSHKRGENYFIVHKYLSLSTVVLWFVSFATGVLLMAGVV